MIKDRVFIIAEAGINHNGSVKTARKLIDAATKIGADAIKFQTFLTGRSISRYAEKAEYQKKSAKNKETQFEMLKGLELSPVAHKELIRYCRKKGITFLSSPFDLCSINLLNNLGLKLFKIPSGEITNLPYLMRIGSLNKKIIMSTGMADFKEVKSALSILISSGTKKENIAILHCTTEYPAPLGSVNLKAMLTIRDRLKVTVGYSDHTLGIEIPIAAVALGARIIEKHFTLNKGMQGPDHKASLQPHEFSLMISGIRNIEKALGNGIKRPADSEKKNICAARKSIVVAKPVRKGEVFTEENITVKRPGLGISPMRWNKIVGMSAKKDFLEDELVEI